MASSIRYQQQDTPITAFPKFDMPKWESDVPQHLLNRSTESEKYIMNAISIAQQQNVFLIAKAKETHEMLASQYLEQANMRNRIRALEAEDEAHTTKVNKIKYLGIIILPSIILIAWEIFKVKVLDLK